MSLLEVSDLSVTFDPQGNPFRAVQDVSFSIDRGEIVGLVGESGSGKSTIGLALMGLTDRRHTDVTGSAVIGGQDLIGASEAQLRSLRGTTISMIFQDAMTALDPVFTVGHQLTETLRAHRTVSRAQAKSRAIEMLDAVGIADPARRFNTYPHQFSGGMRQRVMIALALLHEPDLIIADEPTTAVDVTIQAQLLTMMKTLAAEQGSAILLITHDLGVVAETCERMLTMYAGRLVEAGAVDDVLARPRHPYTHGLLESLPGAHSRKQPLATIPGRVPGPGESVSGCAFHPRCRFSVDACEQTEPDLVPAGAGQSRCLRVNELVMRGRSTW